MSHRAAIYTIQVYKKRRPSETRLLGDIDGSGTYIADRFRSYLTGFAHADSGTGKSVRCEAADQDGHEVRVTFEAGESGVVADIYDRQGAHRLRQEATDTQFVRCASLFRFDPAQKIGWWAVHHNHGRSAKRLVQDRLLEAFNHQHDDLTLRIDPAVNGAALAKAIDDGRLDAITLTRLEKPSDRSAASTDTWVKASDRARLELRVVGDRGHRLKTAAVKRFLNGNAQAFGDIVTFEGIRFDEAKVSVELEDGRERTFNLERPESGHAFTRDIPNELLSFRDGEPTPESLLDQLGVVLDDLT